MHKALRVILDTGAQGPPGSGGAGSQGPKGVEGDIVA